MRLTKTVVERLPLPEKESTPYWDDELSGFGVRIWASGKRSYIVQGRANGRSRRVTIGQHGAPISDTQTLTADKARKLAMSLIGVITQRMYRVEVWKMNAPKLAVTDEKWVYITKYHHNGQIGKRSIGLPESDLTALLTLLGQAVN